MIRKRKLGTLMLVVLIAAALRCAAVPLSTVRHAPPIAHVVQAHDNVLPDSVSVRGFDVNTPVGMDLLDPGAEAVFDN